MGTHAVSVLGNGDHDGRQSTSVLLWRAIGWLQVPMPKSKQFYAYGRVFSGTVRPGMKVTVKDNAESGEWSVYGRISCHGKRKI